jgi:hypothetical protein
MDAPIQLLFHEAGPGVVRPAVKGPYRATLLDGTQQLVTHHVFYHVTAFGQRSLSECVDRIDEVYNDSRAWPAAGVRWVHLEDRERADVAVEFKVQTKNGSLFTSGPRRSRPLYVLLLPEEHCFRFHEGLLHESGHCVRAYHMREWPDYPYSGVMWAKQTEGDAWFSKHDLLGLRNYKRGSGRTAPRDT